MAISVIELILISIGLAMDAFAVSVCKGLAFGKPKFYRMAIVGLYFGFFQMAMPLIGYFIGSTFASYISSFDHWIAFALLLIIGVHMIVSAIRDKEETVTDTMKPGEMILLAIATSIDALAVGVSFSMIGFNVGGIFIATGTIGIITFILSGLGVFIGGLFGSKNKKIAEIVGGSILVLIGLKILLSDLGVLPF